MGLFCFECGQRFYLPPGEQLWLQKRSTASVTKPGIPQLCLPCVERRFARTVQKANQTRSRDGSVRMPSGAMEILSSYAEVPVPFLGERLKTPVAILGCDASCIQFQRIKTGQTFFGRLSEELPKGSVTVFLDKDRSATSLPPGVPLHGCIISIEYVSRKCLFFDAENNTVTVDSSFPMRIFSQTSYYIFKSFGAEIPEPLCPNDSISALRSRAVRDENLATAKTKQKAFKTKMAQENTILADVWGPPCKVHESLGRNWNVETLSGPQRRLKSNCLNYVNALVVAAQHGSLVDHSILILEARMLAFCLGTHPRCGRNCLIFHLLAKHVNIVHRIATLAENELKALPKWFFDKETSNTMSEGLLTPMAVFVALHPLEFTTQVNAVKQKVFEADKRRLLLQASKAAKDNSDTKNSVIIGDKVVISKHSLHVNSTLASPSNSLLPSAESSSTGSVGLPSADLGWVKKRVVLLSADLGKDEKGRGNTNHREEEDKGEKKDGKGLDKEEELTNNAGEMEEQVENLAAQGELIRPLHMKAITIRKGAWKKSIKAKLLALDDSQEQAWLCKSESILERFLVVDGQRRCVCGFDRGGRLEVTFGANVLYCPSGIVSIRRQSGAVVVSDSWLHALLVFDWDGNFQSRIGYKGSEEGLFDRPLGLALGKDDELYVADSGNHRIQVLSGHGKFIRAFGEHGYTAGKFDTPTSVSVDVKRGLVAVAERGNSMAVKELF
jgi:hypothetical protein